ncbi:MAG: hypothetical protein A2X56_08650 [Nitrospirae bacterium GWC2_57_13]|nr:MAG: hypothetical protein A2072_08460 [Nitrospirae bacterium GWC1_57_7]OGW27998.1 MAG: hypothetical protein A2X56_08650 [Nitrospirae bacterium GWC2_57_13]OGW42848.1 MAG: hypothetical protein A2X57_01770 [Nitrospirae bacterium GWD2_57_8]HAR45557.1 hypothetical protein [Nitrospiraceae bacterium]HAS53142.1 hypothetical protein [Nitrospiraceae bacterium]
MTDDSSAVEKSKIAREILNYLADHPDAEDTLDGIVQWWLLERKIYQHTAAVQEALEGLVAEGVILEQRQVEASAVYRVRRKENGAISRQDRWLRKSEG